MKKRILVLGILLVALLFVFVPQAHAGVGNTLFILVVVAVEVVGLVEVVAGLVVEAAGLVDPVATVLVLEQTLVVLQLSLSLA